MNPKGRSSIRKSPVTSFVLYIIVGMFFGMIAYTINDFWLFSLSVGFFMFLVELIVELEIFE